MNEYEKVIYYCTNFIFKDTPEKTPKILQCLALDEAKHGSRQISPHWNMLKMLLNLYESHYYRDYQVCRKTLGKIVYSFNSLVLSILCLKPD